MLHARAKRLAKQRKTSVSGLFEPFIKEQAESNAGALTRNLPDYKNSPVPALSPDQFLELEVDSKR